MGCHGMKNVVFYLGAIFWGEQYGQIHCFQKGMILLYAGQEVEACEGMVGISVSPVTLEAPWTGQGRG